MNIFENFLLVYTKFQHHLKLNLDSIWLFRHHYHQSRTLGCANRSMELTGALQGMGLIKKA